MKLRPTIFLSGVSSEFRSFRDAAEIEVQKKGCFPVNQPSFGVDYREIAEILRTKLHEADALVHIVGFRFGFEPRNLPDGASRRSYTQMEYYIARELGIPVYVFLSADATVRDSDEPMEDSEAIELQLAHRKTVSEHSDNIHFIFKNTNELRNLVGGIPLLATADFRVDIGRIDRYAPAALIGRESELKLLDDAWLKVRRAESMRHHILTFVALGGEGKTSLIAKWLARLAYENWPGCDSAFAWSFYSQGSREQSAVSSDLFLKEAISFFGNDADKKFAASNVGAYEKGQRLARIVGQRRSILILDGLEPLQYAPTSPTPGELKDAGVVALLKALAAVSDSLCIVTTRYSLPNLRAFWQTTAPEISLTHLSLEAGVHLLKSSGVHGSQRELEALVEDVKGHALTVNLLGTYLRDAHGGDIRRRDLVKLEEADVEEYGGHAFRVIEAYEEAFVSEGDKGQRALTILRLIGLFDRPVSADSLLALLQEPAISGLTESLAGSSKAQLNVTFKRLEHARLITVNREASTNLISLDAHPLLREYFGKELRMKQPETWRTAHQRLYEHLCGTTLDKREPTLEDLQPLYNAIAHGCHAQLHQDACDHVYHTRIKRGSRQYTWYRLGAYGSELGALICFFDKPWIQLSPQLSEEAQAWLLNEAAFCLTVLGRLTEALEPLRVGHPIELKNGDWENLSVRFTNLCHLQLVLGEIQRATADGEQAMDYGDRSRSPFRWMVARSAYGDVLHNAGQRRAARHHFREAEKISKEKLSFKFLFGPAGFQYCDLLMHIHEFAAWRCVLQGPNSTLHGLINQKSRYAKELKMISRRVRQTIQWAKSIGFNTLLAIALDRLTLARVVLFEAVLGIGSLPTKSSKPITVAEDAVKALRSAGSQEYLARGLLTRAWIWFFSDVATGSAGAQADLDEAWEIAERGPMRLHMADIHLYRARLFFREKEYPWDSPEADLAAARKLIEQCGYWRRKEELEDAEHVILKKSV